MQEITIRQHCIPSHDILCKLNKISLFPEDIQNMEGRTAGGILKKLRTVINSDYFKQLPQEYIIPYDNRESVQWNKKECSKEAKTILKQTGY